MNLTTAQENDLLAGNMSVAEYHNLMRNSRYIKVITKFSELLLEQGMSVHQSQQTISAIPFKAEGSRDLNEDDIIALRLLAFVVVHSYEVMFPIVGNNGFYQILSRSHAEFSI